MNTAPKPRLFLRLMGSHLLLTATVGILAAVLLFASAYLVEDRAYRALLESSLREAMHTGSARVEPIRAERLEEAAPELREFAASRSDGTWEWEEESTEKHVALATDAAGDRWVASLSLSEVEQDRRLAAALAGGVLLLSIAALGVGFLVARRTLTPLEELTARLQREQPPPTPERLRTNAGDDEVGFLATELARFLQDRELALERERSFLRDASHELRNPLSILRGGVELLREADAGNDALHRERLDRMERSISRMQRTVEELLHLARQESSLAQESERSLAEGLEDLVEELRPTANDQILLEVKEEGRPDGPANLWLIVLRNLLENALAATERGSIVVTLRADGIRVRDTGHGLAPELLERVTDSFVGDPASSGFGLGLSIVRRLGERLGHELKIASSDEGTTVELVERPAGSTR